MRSLKKVSWVIGVPLLAVWCALVGAPAGALAAEIRNGPSAQVASGETIDDDVFIGGGQTATISGHVTGDAYAAAENVIVNGTIDGDLITAAQQVIVDGTIRGNLRAAGAGVTINGEVGRNVTGLAQHVNVTSNGRVAGSILALGQTIDAFGQVGRGMTVGGGTLQLAGPVGGPVLARVESLAVAPTARLASTLDYQAKQQTAIPDGTVNGGVQFAPTPQGAEQPAPVLNGLFDLGGLIGLCGSFLIGALALILMPRASARAVELGRQRPWQSFGLGLLVLFGVPIAALLVGITLVGLPVAACMVALYVLGIILAWPAVGLLVGGQLTRLVRADRPLPVPGTLAVGLIAVHLVTHVPFIGPLLGFCVIVFGLGIMAQAIRRSRQQSEQSRAAAPVALAA
jgi:hypothetical protein